MSFKKVLKNVKKKGFRKTAKLYINNKTADKNFRKIERDFERQISKSDDPIAVLEKYTEMIRKSYKYVDNEKLYDGMQILCKYLSENRSKLTDHKEQLSNINAVLMEVELKKKYKKVIKRKYVKELIPAAYYEKSSLPVRDKIIIMEHGDSPSPSSEHIGKTLEKQGKYDVVYHSLYDRKMPMTEYYECAIRFAADSADARAVLISTSDPLFSYIDLRPETKLIQLWHGVGMFKKCGWSTVSAGYGNSERCRLEYDVYKNYYAVTTAAEEQAWTFKDAMHLDESQIRAIGVSRTDLFYDPEFASESKSTLLDKYPQIGDRKIILYAPTFRGKVASGQAPDQLDIEMMADALKDDYVLLIKHHELSHNVPEIPASCKDSFAYDLGTDPVIGIDRLLTIADICITDYSSVGFEYAILERPIIFFAYDIDEYLDERGMYFNYEDITPGPICKTTGEITEYIEKIEELFDINEVRAFKNKYVNMCDGHATERTIALIEE